MWVKEPYRSGSRFAAWRWKGETPPTVFHLARPHVVRSIVRTGEINTWKGAGRGLTLMVSRGTSFTTHPYLLAATSLLAPWIGLKNWGYVEVKTEAIPGLVPTEYTYYPTLGLYTGHKVLPGFGRQEAEFWTPRKRFEIPAGGIASAVETIDIGHPTIKEIHSSTWGAAMRAYWRAIDRTLLGPAGAGSSGA